MKKILTLLLGALLWASGGYCETINVSWTDTQTDIDGYRIYDKNNVLVIEVPPTERTASFEETKCNSWRNVAYRGDLESKISNSAQWCPEPPDAPGDLRIH